MARQRSSDPVYSVVLPVYRATPSLARTLESIFRLSGKISFELIVVENGPAVLPQRLLRGLPCTRLLSLPRANRAAARNCGARSAQGRFLAFVDSDVELSPGWLEQVDRFRRRYDLDAIATSVVPQGNEGTLDSYRKRCGEVKSGGSFVSMRVWDRFFPLLNTAACAISKRAFHLAGGFPEVLPRNEDLHLSINLFRRGFLLGGTSLALAKVSYHPDQASEWKRVLHYLWRAAELEYWNVRLPGLFGLRRMDASDSHFTSAHLALHQGVRFAQAAGTALQRISACSSRRIEFLPGRSAASFSFPHGQSTVTLRPGLSFCFFDDDILLFEAFHFRGKLPSTARKGLQQLIHGRPPGREVRDALLACGAFSLSDKARTW